MTRCVKGPASHDFPIESEFGARCPEHGVTLLWRGDSIAPAEPAEIEAAGERMAALLDGQRSALCRAGEVHDVPDAHGRCEHPTCACPCHVVSGP